MLATNDDYNGKVNFRITATLVQNTVYYIKVTASNMNTGSYTLKVTANVLPLTISIIPNHQDGVVVLEAGKTYELPRGEGFDFLNVANTSPAPLSVEVTPSNTTNKSVYWSSSSIFTDSVNVTESWYNTTKYPSVTAENVGGAKLFASDIETVAQRGVAYVAVIPQGGSLVKATGITIDHSSVTVATGNYDELNATVSPANATVKDVEWVSDDPAIATVSPFGRIKGISCGTTTIRAKAMDGSGVESVCQVNVIQAIPIMKITLSPDEISLNKGDQALLTEKILPTNATTKTLRWTSSNRGVAEVDSSTGIITAMSGGDAYIYAEAQDGSKVRAYSKVHVTQTIVDRAEEAHKNSVEGSTASDPVDVYTGAHMINNTLMTLFGGQGISLVAHYDSAQLVSGMLGHGWYHNYEKRIEVTGTEARVFNNPSIFSRYEADSDCCTRFSCCSANKNGYVLTVDTSHQYPYSIDCNSARTEYYDSQGNLAKIKDHQGFETLISHSNTLITITDCVSGKKMYLEKNADGKVTRVYDESNRQAILTYTNGLLTSIRDVNGNALTYAYDEKNRIVSGTDSRNTRYFENTYDKYGRVCTQKDALNHTTYFEYHDDPCESCDGIVRTVTNRLGKKSYRVYDNKARLIKYIDENDNSKTYEYDEHDNVIKEIDAKGYAVTKVYNRFNKPTQVTDRNGNTTYFTYDACGNVTKIRYPAIDGIVPEETFTYNTHNQMTQHVDIRGTVTVYTYEVNGMPATKKVGSKNAVVYSYESGLLKAQTDARGYTTRYAHNASGQVISKTDADNKVTTYEYDQSGNLIKTIDANGKSIVTTYDGNYQKKSVTDANGNTTSYSYNGNMKNIGTTLPDGNTLRNEFDAEDRVVRVFDQLNHKTEITYDDGGRVLSKKLHDGATMLYEYDAVGNVVKETNPKGAVVSKMYDKLGNVLTVTDDAGKTTS